MNRVTSPPSASASKAARLAGYLAGGVGSTLLATPAADAAIVTLNLASLGTNGVDITGTNAGIAFGGAKKRAENLLGALGGAMDVYFGSGQIGLDADNFNSGTLQFAVNSFSSADPKNFALNASIDNASWSTWTGSAGSTEFRNGATAASADFGANSFMGFRLQNGTDYYFGYFEVTWTYTGTDSTSTFQILSGAYEDTANTGILAGATASAVPAGGGLMALMALGGGAFRRRGRAA